MPQPKRNPRQRQGFRNNGWKCDLVATSSRCFFLTGNPCQVAVRSGVRHGQLWVSIRLMAKTRQVDPLVDATTHSLNGCVFGLVPAVSAVGIRRPCDEVLLHSMSYCREEVISPVVRAVERPKCSGQDGPVIMASPLRISSSWSSGGAADGVSSSRSSVSFGLIVTQRDALMLAMRMS